MKMNGGSSPRQQVMSARQDVLRGSWSGRSFRPGVHTARHPAAPAQIGAASWIKPDDLPCCPRTATQCLPPHSPITRTPAPAPVSLAAVASGHVWSVIHPGRTPSTTRSRTAGTFQHHALQGGGSAPAPPAPVRPGWSSKPHRWRSATRRADRPPGGRRSPDMLGEGLSQPSEFTTPAVKPTRNKHSCEPQLISTAAAVHARLEAQTVLPVRRVTCDRPRRLARTP